MDDEEERSAPCPNCGSERIVDGQVARAEAVKAELDDDVVDDDRSQDGSGA